MYYLARKIFDFCLWLLLPPFCVHCKKLLHSNTVLCCDCLKTVKSLVSFELKVNKKTTIWVYAFSHYQDPIKPLILAKIQSQRLASVQLGELMLTMPVIQQADFDYIIPIPLHWTRFAYRGYNQAEEIARVISQRSGKPVVNLLIRNRKTIFQSYLPSNQREANVIKAFSLNMKLANEIYHNKRFIIVDDLMTTGSTLKSAVQVFAQLNPLSIKAVVASRTV